MLNYFLVSPRYRVSIHGKLPDDYSEKYNQADEARKRNEQQRMEQEYLLYQQTRGNKWHKAEPQKLSALLRKKNEENLFCFCSVMMLIGRQAAATFELNDNVGGGKAVLSLSDGIVQEQDKGSQPEDKQGKKIRVFFPLWTFLFQENKPKLTAMPNERRKLLLSV